MQIWVREISEIWLILTKLHIQMEMTCKKYILYMYTNQLY